MDLSIHSVKEIILHKANRLESGTLCTHLEIKATVFSDGKDRPITLEISLFHDDNLLITGEN